MTTGETKSPRRPGPGMPSVSGTYGQGQSAKLVVRIGDDRKLKLQAIAQAQGKTPSDMIRDFIDAL